MNSVQLKSLSRCFNLLELPSYEQAALFRTLCGKGPLPPGYAIEDGILCCNGQGKIDLQKAEPIYSIALRERKVQQLLALQCFKMPLFSDPKALRSLVERIERIRSNPEELLQGERSAFEKRLFVWKRASQRLSIFILTDIFLGQGKYRKAYLTVKYESGRRGQPKCVAHTIAHGDQITPVLTKLAVALNKREVPSYTSPMFNLVILPYANEGTFQSLFSSTLTDYGRHELVKEALRTLSRLHAKDIAVRDIKPDNLLVSSRQDSFSVLITDLNHSTSCSDTQPQGAPGYRSPELFLQEDERGDFQGETVRGDAHDLFSLGIVFWQLHRFQHALPSWIEQAFKEKERGLWGTYRFYYERYKLRNWKYLSPAHRLFFQMMHYMPSQRPSAEEALKRLLTIDLQHFWVRGVPKMSAK